MDAAVSENPLSNFSKRDGVLFFQKRKPEKSNAKKMDPIA